MSECCKIQWVSMADGRPTPDTNPAVGIAMIEYSDGTFHEYPVCAAHLPQLRSMERADWCYFRGERVSRWHFIPASDFAL